MTTDPRISAAPSIVASEFVGKWHTLVSTTNWEKGKIISEWRRSLESSDARPGEYADDAWATLVGGVTPQHVGRLRRVYERFGATHSGFQGLYWSHFFAALDWDDAEMWLEGAVQNDWSVSRMKKQRQETLGLLPTDDSSDDELESVEDEGVDADIDVETSVADAAIGESVAPVVDPDEESPKVKRPATSADSRTDRTSGGDPADTSEPGVKIYAEDDREAVSFVRSFANLSELPDDLAEAFESFKLAILRHKLSDWSDVAREDVLASLDALRELASSPTIEPMPS